MLRWQLPLIVCGIVALLPASEALEQGNLLNDFGNESDFRQPTYLEIFGKVKHLRSDVIDLFEKVEKALKSDNAQAAESVEKISQTWLEIPSMFACVLMWN